MSRVHVYAEAPSRGPKFVEPPVVGFFDPDNAERFSEARESDGTSGATRSRWEHECLYRTRKGSWVLEHQVNYQHGQDWHEFVTDERAEDWLLRNGHSKAAKKLFGPAQDERGSGRPEIGGAVHVRLGDLLVRVDAYAAGQLDGMSRAEAIRELVSLGLKHVGL
jgi:hypothetical protein